MDNAKAAIDRLDGALDEYNALKKDIDRLADDSIFLSSIYFGNVCRQDYSLQRHGRRNSQRESAAFQCTDNHILHCHHNKRFSDIPLRFQMGLWTQMAVKKKEHQSGI